MRSRLKTLATACMALSLAIPALAIDDVLKPAPTPAAKKQELGTAFLKVMNEAMASVAAAKKKRPEMTLPEEFSGFERELSRIEKERPGSFPPLEQWMPVLVADFLNDLPPSVQQILLGQKANATDQERDVAHDAGYDKLKAQCDSMIARVKKEKTLTYLDLYELMKSTVVEETVLKSERASVSKSNADVAFYAVRVAFISKLRQAHGLSAMTEFPNEPPPSPAPVTNPSPPVPGASNDPAPPKTDADARVKSAPPAADSGASPQQPVSAPVGSVKR